MTDLSPPLITEPTSASSVTTPRIDQPTRLSPDVLANKAGALRSDVGILSEDVAQVHDWSLMYQLEVRTDEEAKRAPAHLLAELSERGFAWTSIARLVGVSIPLIRKWRQGGAMSGGNRRKLARLIAFVGVLEHDRLISDVVSWLDMPLANSVFTGIDVLVAGYEDTLGLYAGGHISGSELLDRTIPDWRDTVDDRFEVFRAGDEVPAIRMRSEVQAG